MANRTELIDEKYNKNSFHVYNFYSEGLYSEDNSKKSKKKRTKIRQDEKLISQTMKNLKKDWRYLLLGFFPEVRDTKFGEKEFRITSDDIMKSFPNVEKRRHFIKSLLLLENVLPSNRKDINLTVDSSGGNEAILFKIPSSFIDTEIKDLSTEDRELLEKSILPIFELYYRDSFKKRKTFGHRFDKFSNIVSTVIIGSFAVGIGALLLMAGPGAIALPAVLLPTVLLIMPPVFIGILVLKALSLNVVALEDMRSNTKNLRDFANFSAKAKQNLTKEIFKEKNSDLQSFMSKKFPQEMKDIVEKTKEDILADNKGVVHNKHSKFNNEVSVSEKHKSEIPSKKSSGSGQLPNSMNEKLNKSNKTLNNDNNKLETTSASIKPGEQAVNNGSKSELGDNDNNFYQKKITTKPNESRSYTKSIPPTRKSYNSQNKGSNKSFVSGLSSSATKETNQKTR